MDTNVREKVAERLKRLKHASELLGWIADGKPLQAQRQVCGADWEDVPQEDRKPWNEAGTVEAILRGEWQYRIKPEPVTFEGITSPYQRPRDGRWMTMIVVDAVLPMGTSVKVTVLES